MNAARCVVCGKEFTVPQRRSTCSNLCRRICNARSRGYKPGTYNYEAFGVRLLKAMDASDTKAKELAYLCAVSLSSVSHWVSGRSLPTSRSLCVIANKLNVTAEYLINGESATVQDK